MDLNSVGADLGTFPKVATTEAAPTPCPALTSGSRPSFSPQVSFHHLAAWGGLTAGPRERHSGDVSGGKIVSTHAKNSGAPVQAHSDFCSVIPSFSLG